MRKLSRKKIDSMSDRQIERHINKLESSMKKKDIAIIFWVFGLDMAYVEGNFLKCVLLWFSCFLIFGFLWHIINIVNISSRLDEVNYEFEEEIDHLEHILSER
tara:strand:- start:4 stop:312 length:309 start_codon:yes stop_codon:yes gene_type:complete